jgi:hypothetical protein
VQQKTQQPVRFELTERTRETVGAWIAEAKLGAGDYLFPSRHQQSHHLSTRQYARIVKGWIGLLGGDPQEYGTHSLRRTKATLIYRRTKNLRAVQLLLRHRKLESTVRYLGIEVDDALEMAERTECRANGTAPALNGRLPAKSGHRWNVRCRATGNRRHRSLGCHTRHSGGFAESLWAALRACPSRLPTTSARLVRRCCCTTW